MCLKSPAGRENQKFNKILMIQIAVFATIPAKAEKSEASGRVPFHLLSAQKFKADPEQDPRA
ncbi:hypothetical protein, partial [Dialister sp.]|uniref:hypothetical protein n=1 Tax=Dialister sp. TaxID=1955814 RepID=UPI002E800946